MQENYIYKVFDSVLHVKLLIELEKRGKWICSDHVPSNALDLLTGEQTGV